MALSALDDLSAEPDNSQLAEVLGPALPAWSTLLNWLTGTLGVGDLSWGSSGKKYGWALRARAGKRTISYLIPQHGTFLVGIVLGGRALEETGRARLAQPVREVIAGARRYAEGTGFRLPVATAGDLEDVQTLLRIKSEVV